MKVLVIGSGLIGVSAAYFLRKRGHDVVVVDRRDGAGLETSFANGSLLTPSMPDPWNAPGCWRVLLSSLVRSDSPLQLRPHAIPSLAGWGLRFLLNSRPAAFEHAIRSNLRLALHSITVMDAVRRETGIEYGRTAIGTLRFFRDGGALDRACTAADRLVPHGLGYRRLSAAGVVELEPGLAPIAHLLAGGMHYPGDETGNAYRFTTGLADHARRNGVTFHYDTAVSKLETSNGRISGVRAGTQNFNADHYVVAAGSYSPLLLDPVGVSIPVRPAKGYSITFATPPRADLLRIPVVDDALHAVVTPVDGMIRVAGTAEFTGYDLSLPDARIQNLQNLVREVLPKGGLDPASAKPWCGLRPMSADGIPIIGPTSISNLSVATGHGHLGWTMAAATGELLADLVSGHQTAVAPEAYAPSRF